MRLASIKNYEIRFRSKCVNKNVLIVNINSMKRVANKFDVKGHSVVKCFVPSLPF